MNFKTRVIRSHEALHNKSSVGGLWELGQDYLNLPDEEKESVSEIFFSFLMDLLQVDSYQLREGGVFCLYTLATSDAMDLLIKTLQDENCDVRARAARYLGELKVSHAVLPLIQTTHEEMKGFRKYSSSCYDTSSPIFGHYIVLLDCILALGEIGDTRTRPFLITLLKETCVRECVMLNNTIEIALERILKEEKGIRRI